ncbi:MAG: hypothetical protein FWF51_08030 [Chitinivibrionia bacterium]|nr:hypothetical protein [Chitinivibrionia bacterium]
MKKLMNLVCTVAVIWGHTAFAQTVEKFQHTTPDGKIMDVYYVLPPVINSETKIMIGMHGTDRNANDIIYNFRSLSIIANYAVIVPEFSLENFPSAEYQNINLAGNIDDYSKWSFHHIDRIFEEFVQRFELSAEKYILVGHSAGAQFTHRTLMFSQSPYLDYGIAANAGAYTFLNEDWNYPRGIKNLLPLKSDLLNNLANKKLYVLIGSDDNDPNAENFDHGDWDVQGLHRYERAFNFYAAAEDYADQNDVILNWEISEMPDVAHSSRRAMPYMLDIIVDAPPSVAHLSGQESVYGTWYARNNSIYIISSDTLTFYDGQTRFVVSINSFTADTNVETIDAVLYPNGFRIRGVYTETENTESINRNVGDSFDYRFYPSTDNRSMVRRGSEYVYKRVIASSAPVSISKPIKSGDGLGIIFEKSIVSDELKIVKIALPDGKERKITSVAIYDNTGNVVFSGEGANAKLWNLRNKQGRIVANGSYLVIVEAKSGDKSYWYSAKIGVKR